MGRTRSSVVEPAQSLLYQPEQLAPVADPPDTTALLRRVGSSLKDPFNDRQAQAVARSFTQRISLLWGPPGTGKTTVLAGIVLTWLENAWVTGEPLCIGIGSSNYNAIDNVLVEVADLLDRRLERVGESPMPTRITRVRSSSAQPPADGRIADIERGSGGADQLARDLTSPNECIVVGGTWMQLSKMARGGRQNNRPIARWLDLLLIDEASQVGVSAAAAYFLLARDGANVVLAGDHKQLGPIHSFEVQDCKEGLFDCIYTYMQDTHRVQATALDQNYRTNIEISGWPGKRFYGEGGYEAFYPDRRLGVCLPAYGDVPPDYWPERLPWSDEFLRILDPSLPIVVVTYPPQPYTLSNPFEAQMIAALAYLYRRMANEHSGDPGDEEFWTEHLGIVTPHRAQMSNIKNLLVEAAGMSVDPPPFVDTVDRFQGQERDLLFASYAVADKDFVGSEEGFILDPRRFNVTLTRARSKFVMFVSDAIVQHLPADAQVARDAAHLQLFVQEYCPLIERIALPFSDNGAPVNMDCRLRGHE